MAKGVKTENQKPSTDTSKTESIVHDRTENPQQALEGQSGDGVIRYVVAKQFRDKDDYRKIWTIGSEVSHFPIQRIAHLKSIGYVTEL